MSGHHKLVASQETRGSRWHRWKFRALVAVAVQAVVVGAALGTAFVSPTSATLTTDTSFIKSYGCTSSPPAGASWAFPVSRMGAAYATDEISTSAYYGLSLMFGGATVAAGTSSSAAISDQGTWEYQNGCWRSLSSTSGISWTPCGYSTATMTVGGDHCVVSGDYPEPEPRWGASMVWDPNIGSTGAFLMYGGCSQMYIPSGFYPDACNGNVFSDLWSFTPTGQFTGYWSLVLSGTCDLGYPYAANDYSSSTSAPAGLDSSCVAILNAGAAGTYASASHYCDSYSNTYCLGFGVYGGSMVYDPDTSQCTNSNHACVLLYGGSDYYTYHDGTDTGPCTSNLILYGTYSDLANVCPDELWEVIGTSTLTWTLVSQSVTDATTDAYSPDTFYAPSSTASCSSQTWSSPGTYTCEVYGSGTLAVSMTLYGGGGGNGYSYDSNGVAGTGGKGGETTATFNLAAGDILTINVGAEGTSGSSPCTASTNPAGGSPGGGPGGNFCEGGGGGGYTRVYDTSTSPLAIAGGGGGGGGVDPCTNPTSTAGKGGNGGGGTSFTYASGNGKSGGAGGGTTETGSGCTGTDGTGGGGGSASGGAAASTDDCYSWGYTAGPTAGASLQGGNGGNGDDGLGDCNDGGGGGGGSGYYGGGGGGSGFYAAGGGGAGSSVANSAATTYSFGTASSVAVGSASITCSSCTNPTVADEINKGDGRAFASLVAPGCTQSSCTLVLTGGVESASTNSGEVSESDTWYLDVGIGSPSSPQYWTQVTSPAPPASEMATEIYDLGSSSFPNEVVRTGGTTTTGSGYSTVSSTIWYFSVTPGSAPSSWSSSAQPAPDDILGTAPFYDTNSALVVVFGGWDMSLAGGSNQAAPSEYYIN